MKDLIDNIKHQLVDALKLEDIDPAEIADDDPIFGDEGLGLDSIDVLEVLVLLEKEYGIKLADPKSARTILSSVRTMADYISQNRTK